MLLNMVSVICRGQVVALTGSGDDAKATVEFANVGVKKLLLKFARLTVLS